MKSCAHGLTPFTSLSAPLPRFDSIAEVIASYPRRFIPEKAQDVDDTVQIRLSGPEGGEWAFHVHDGRLDIRDGSAPDPTLTLEAPADVWLRIENGQMNPLMALMTGQIKLSGSVPFGTRFMAMFGRET